MKETSARTKQSRPHPKPEGTAFMRIPGHDPQGNYWQGYEWSGWTEFRKFLASKAPRGHKSHSAGLYRFRVRRHVGLVYVGVTTRSIRGRLAQHMVYIESVMANADDPAPSLAVSRKLAQYLDSGFQIEVSWVALPKLEKPDLHGVEAELIAAYRATMGSNPECQFLSTTEEGPP